MPKVKARKPSERIQIYLMPSSSRDEAVLRVWKKAQTSDRAPDLFREILYTGLRELLRTGRLPAEIAKIPQLVAAFGGDQSPVAAPAPAVPPMPAAYPYPMPYPYPPAGVHPMAPPSLYAPMAPAPSNAPQGAEHRHPGPAPAPVAHVPEAPPTPLAAEVAVPPPATGPTESAEVVPLSARRDPAFVEGDGGEGEKPKAAAGGGMKIMALMGARAQE